MKIKSFIIAFVAFSLILAINIFAEIIDETEIELGETAEITEAHTHSWVYTKTNSSVTHSVHCQNDNCPVDPYYQNHTGRLKCVDDCNLCGYYFIASHSYTAIEQFDNTRGAEKHQTLCGNMWQSGRCGEIDHNSQVYCTPYGSTWIESNLTKGKHEENKLCELCYGDVFINWVDCQLNEGKSSCDYCDGDFDW